MGRPAAVRRALDHDLVRRGVQEVDAAVLAARLEWLTRVRGGEPVIVFQMGKVGSTSVASSFPTRRHPLAVQTHHLAPDRIDAITLRLRAAGRPVRRHYRRAEVVARRVVEPGRGFKCITLVREPLGRLVSAFFQSFEDEVGTSLTTTRFSVEELVELLVDQSSRLDRSGWFERELEPALGVDVFAQPFPWDVGYQRLRAGAGELLLLRVELPDPDKEQVIADFLGEESFALASANTGVRKGYADQYRHFRETARLPDELVDRVLGSRWARHFYSPDELAASRDRWTGT